MSDWIVVDAALSDWIVWGTHGEPVDRAPVPFEPVVRLTRAHSPRGDGLTACGLVIPTWAATYPADATDKQCPRCRRLTSGRLVPVSELRVNNRLWLISDTHFGHRNIVAYQQRPASHEAIMLSEWIKRVPDGAQILHLGDVWLGPRSSDWRWAAIVSRLPGEKFLILGNHDQSKRELYEQAGFTVVPPFVHRGHAFTHRPVSLEYPIEHDPSCESNVGFYASAIPAPCTCTCGAEWHTNIHGHTHGNAHRPDHDGTLLKGKAYVNLSVEVTDLAPVQLGNVWAKTLREDQ